MKKYFSFYFAIFFLLCMQAQPVSTGSFSLIAGNQNYYQSVFPLDVTTDLSDNVFVTGSFLGAITTPTNLVVPQNQAGIYLFKYNSTGAFQWGLNIGNAASITPYGIEADGSGNVYWFGSIVGNNQDILVRKYNSSGALLWSISLGGSGNDFANSLEVDNAGNIVVTGEFSGTVDFNPVSGIDYNLNNGGSFVSVYNSSGAFVRAFNIPAAIKSMVLDASSNILVAGTFNGTVDFDWETSTPPQNRTSAVSNMFIAKYTQNGNFVWVDHLQSSGGLTDPREITVDASGNVIATGSIKFSASTDFDPGVGTANLTSNGYSDIFIAKYDPNGNYQFALNIGNTENDYGKSVKTDLLGNIYCSCTYTTTVDFDPGAGSTTLSPGYFNGYPQESEFVGKYSPTGVFQWVLNGYAGDHDDKIDIDTHSNLIWQTMGYNVNGTSITYLGKFCEPPTILIASSAAGTVCKGSAVTLTASGGNTYSWGGTNNQSTLTVTPSFTTTYTVTGTNANGCSASKSITVNVYAETMSVAATSASICPGTTSTLTASGGTSFSWTPNDGVYISPTSVKVSPASTTAYIVSGIDNNGCTSSKSITVSVRALTLGITSTKNTVCANEQFYLTVTGANFNSNYTWTKSNSTFNPYSYNASLSETISTETTYTVNASTNTNFCPETKSITISVNQLPTVSVGTINPVCVGGSATITASGALTYSWSPSTGLSATTGATVIATPTAASTLYWVKGTDANGCYSNTPFYVFISNPPKPTINGIPYCGSTGNVTCTGAQVGDTFAWSNGASGSSTTATNGETLTVTSTNIHGCSATSNPYTSTDGRPSLKISPTGTLKPCSGTNATLTASAGTNYSWYRNDVVIPGATSQSMTITQGGDYYAKANSTSCLSTNLATGKIKITAPDFTASIVGNTTFCQGSHAELQVIYDFEGSFYPSFLWSTGANTAFINVTTPGTYSVIVTNIFTGCSVSAFAEVTQRENTNGAYITSSSSCINGSATLTAYPYGAVYTWFRNGEGMGLNSQSITIYDAANYSVSIWDDGWNGYSTAEACLDIFPCFYQRVATAEETAVEEKEVEKSDQQFNVYPNPSSDRLIVAMRNSESQEVTIKFIDTMGRVSEQSTIPSGKREKEFNTSQMAAGVYLIRIQSEGRGISDYKVVIVH
jgi:hypothetical protein